MKNEETELVIAREGKSVNIIGNQQKNTTIITCFIPLILQAKKFLKCDWLRQVVFKPNLKYLHVKITPA